MNEESFFRSLTLMSTVVTIRVVGHGADSKEANHREGTVERAFEWFRRIEACCTREHSLNPLPQLGHVLRRFIHPRQRRAA